MYLFFFGGKGYKIFIQFYHDRVNAGVKENFGVKASVFSTCVCLCLCLCLCERNIKLSLPLVRLPQTPLLLLSFLPQPLPSIMPSSWTLTIRSPPNRRRRSLSLHTSARRRHLSSFSPSRRPPLSSLCWIHLAQLSSSSRSWASSFSGLCSLFYYLHMG